MEIRPCPIIGIPTNHYGAAQEYEPATRGSNTSWGWIAGALAIVVVVAIAFGVGHGPTRTASNDTSPAAIQSPPPSPHASDESGPSRPDAASGAGELAISVTSALVQRSQTAPVHKPGPYPF